MIIELGVFQIFRSGSIVVRTKNGQPIEKCYYSISVDDNGVAFRGRKYVSKISILEAFVEGEEEKGFGHFMQCPTDIAREIRIAIEI